MTRIARFLTAAVPAVLLVANLAGAADTTAAARKLCMWGVTGDNASVTMIGSVHVGTPQMYPLPEVMEEAFAAAPVVAVELDVLAPETLQAVMATVMAKGLLPGTETVRDHLAPEIYAKLVAFCAERDIPLAVYGKFKPGILALTLMAEEYERQGFRSDLGIDTHFLTAARAVDKQIRELETVESQMSLFFSVDEQLDDVLFANLLDQMDQLVPLTNEMIELLLTGQSEALYTFIERNMGDEPAMVSFMDDVIRKRNLAMVEKIDAWLHGDQDVFVIIGAGHFGGEHGIVHLLRRRGWTVEQKERGRP